VAQRAKLDKENFWLHKFRATFATWSLWAGVDLRTVQQWLGHSDMESTMRYLKPSRSQHVRDKVNGFLLRALWLPKRLRGEFVEPAEIPDLFVPDRFSFVSVALGRTDRKFPSALAVTPQVATTAYAGDINGDGLLDIFIGGLPDNFFGTVFRNGGNDSFPFAVNTDPTSFMVADLTGKGVVDLIGVSNSGLVIWPNDGTFNFSSSPITLPPINGPIMVADMDGDGHPDIVGSGQIFYGIGAYQFTPVATPNVFPGPYLIGDFNGDGKLDIAVGGATLVNAGNRTFNAVTSDALPLVNGVVAAVADFNGDGKDDVAFSDGGQNVVIFYGQSDGTFYLATELDAGGFVAGLTVGDFNGDGRIDVAAGLMLAQQGVIFFANGNGQFSRSFFASEADTVSMTAADLNHNCSQPPS
jgi:hypothetical protein